MSAIIINTLLIWLFIGAAMLTAVTNFRIPDEEVEDIQDRLREERDGY